MIRLAALLLAAVPCARAASLPSFEQTLNAVHLELRAARAGQVKAKTAAQSGEIDRLGRDVSYLNSTLWRLRSGLGDVQRRAQRPQSDPFLRNDVQRLAWDLRDLARRARSAAQDARSLADRSAKDPELVAPARNLLAEAQRLGSETRWLETDARNAGWDLRRAGLSAEAWDVERESGDAAFSARELEDAARALLDKVS